MEVQLIFTESTDGRHLLVTDGDDKSIYSIGTIDGLTDFIRDITNTTYDKHGENLYVLSGQGHKKACKVYDIFEEQRSLSLNI